MIIIDNEILFLGGLDLCYGRYEIPGYKLKEPNPNTIIWYG